MNPIRPPIQTPLPQTQTQGQRLQGESALFALARAKFAAAQAPVEAPATAAPAATPAPVQRMAAAPTDAPQKILRPGSLLDIRI